MAFVSDTVLLRQLTDGQLHVELSELSAERLRAYYIALERRIIGANVAMFEYNAMQPWVPYNGTTELECAHDVVHKRWMEVTRALDFWEAHDLASTAHERRETIRGEVRAKLGPAPDRASEAEDGQGEVRGHDDPSDRDARLPQTAA